MRRLRVVAEMIPCDACAGRGTWLKHWPTRGPEGFRSRTIEETCRCCKGHGEVGESLPVIECVVIARGGLWIAEAWVGDERVKYRTSTLGGHSAAKQLGYGDERAHYEYRRRFPRGYRLVLDRSNDPARAGQVSVPAGPGRGSGQVASRGDGK